MRKFGSVSAVEVLRDPEAPWVIMFHGYGADAYDLAALGDVLQTPRPMNFLFPQGLLEVSIGGGWTGRAWWQIRLDRDLSDLSSETPEGLEAVRTKVFNMIAQLNVPWSKIILGGFSQGGMVAVDIALNAPEKPLGLIALSSALINKKNLKDKLSDKKDMPFFLSHGDNDPVLPYQNSSRLESFLLSGGLRGNLKTFSGAHEIPPQVIRALSQWLSERI